MAFRRGGYHCNIILFILQESSNCEVLWLAKLLGIMINLMMTSAVQCVTLQMKCKVMGRTAFYMGRREHLVRLVIIKKKIDTYTKKFDGVKNRRYLR